MSKPARPDISAVERAGQALRAAEAAVADARLALAAELRRGRDRGATWQALAEATGFSASRIHQIVAYEGRKRPEGKA